MDIPSGYIPLNKVDPQDDKDTRNDDVVFSLNGLVCCKIALFNKTYTLSTSSAHRPITSNTLVLVCEEAFEQAGTIEFQDAGICHILSMDDIRGILSDGVFVDTLY